jgi:hypothetical protein
MIEIVLGLLVEQMEVQFDKFQNNGLTFHSFNSPFLLEVT